MAIATRRGDAALALQYTIEACWLGRILIAATEQGVCAILLGEDADALTSDLQRRFAKAGLRQHDGSREPLFSDVVNFVENPSLGLTAPLDLRGTAFQKLVWDAMREIPFGSTASYTQIAQRVDRPQSVRAVAQACGANPLAVVVPCHRVICLDGSLSGYRWGVQRKVQLQQREQQLLVTDSPPAESPLLA